MLKVTLISLFACAISCASAFAQPSKVDSSKMQTLRIDPEASRGASVSQVFSQVEFIPLETTKESLFGSIGQLEVTKDRYLVYDYDTRSILIFTLQGKFKAKINSSKMEKDPNPGTNTNKDVYGFSLVEEAGLPVMQVYLGRYFFYYDTDGKLLRRVLSKNIPWGNDRKFSDSTSISTYYVDSTDKDSTRYDIALMKNKKEHGKYFPFPKNRYDGDDFYGSGENLTSSGSPDEYFYERYYMNDIYRITSKSVFLDYKIIFPAAMSLPKDFITKCK
ncbi:MAG: 6-bladed beta-propeller [Pedobacter sp.]|nr:MAG: 6-bladed beta-propeller [Pedobacter sp.]